MWNNILIFLIHEICESKNRACIVYFDLVIIVYRVCIVIHDTLKIHDNDNDRAFFTTVVTITVPGTVPTYSTGNQKQTSNWLNIR